jgi:chromosome segregation ATPase
MPNSNNAMKTKKKTFPILTLCAFLILFAGLGYLGLRHRSLLKERDGLVADRATLEEKAATLKKSYTEQRTQSDNSLRARQAAEAKAAKANQLLSEQEGKIKEFQGKAEALEAQLEKQLASDKEKQEQQQEQVREAISQWKAKVEELQGANAASQTKIKEHEAHIAELDGLASSTKAALENETKQHQSSREKNIKLAGIAQDLAKNYQKKGVVDVLRTNEPLTQLKKVELEKLVQEYLDQIDTETLPRTGAALQ